ncbi:B3 domain-containing protein at3g19184 [Phtheirospermum japonicum]|uniref:B3 domain-containing protein at3g19184 n=1 Tax=Phtheirospermum japonicum TaxID=374723 RepID=A0A830CKJ5_9LAMI|nr:B3 domain-containing protein at3g19184 [Phtheirospermum japonicum]
MEELNLNKLTQSLHTPKPSPMKRAKPRVPKQLLDVSVIRRSSRVVDLSPRNYKEVPIETMGRAARTRSYSSGHSRRDLSDQIYASYEDREYATQRAEDLQSGLDQDIPNFVKPMLQSHVTGGFWMMMLLLKFPVFGFAEIGGLGANSNWGKELEKLALEAGFSRAKHYETSGGLMDGPDGYPLSYDEFIAQQSHAVQNLIGQSAMMNDSDLMILDNLDTANHLSAVISVRISKDKNKFDVRLRSSVLALFPSLCFRLLVLALAVIGSHPNGQTALDGFALELCVSIASWS